LIGKALLVGRERLIENRMIGIMEAKIGTSIGLRSKLAGINEKHLFILEGNMILSSKRVRFEDEGVTIPDFRAKD